MRAPGLVFRGRRDHGPIIMIRLFLVVLLALTGIGSASMTAAWKVPIGQLAPDHENSDQVRKLEKAPGASGFFMPGDELWDVSKVLETGSSWRMPVDPSEETGPKLPWAGEWAVWNARSQMLIARGDYIDIIEAQQASGFDHSPRVVRAIFDLTRGGKTQTIPVVHEGEEGIARVDDIEVESEAWSDPNGFPFLLGAVSWDAGKKESRWNVVTSLVDRSGKRNLVARHGSGGAAWELHVRTVTELVDGTPLADSRWIEIGTGKPRAWPDSDGRIPKLAREALGDGLFIAAYQLPPPFMKGPPPALIPDIDAPGRLRGWIHGRFLNVADTAKELGIDADAAGFFAGVETRCNQLVLVGMASDHDRVGKEVTGIFAPPPEVVLTETDERSGNWALLCGDGFKAVIALTEREGDMDRNVKSFEVEPSLTGANAGVDLRYAHSLPENPGEFTAGTAQLKAGEWQEVGEAIQPKAGPRVSLRASLLEP